MIGDTNDMVARMRATLPARWFGEPENTPILGAVLTGLGTAWSYCYGLLAFTRQQMRLATSSGIFIDLWAAGWFGPTGLPRNTNESDAAYIARIQANLFLVKATRPSFISGMTAATGIAPAVFEPARVIDTGGWGTLSNPAVGGGGGFDQGGIRWGSFQAPGEVFVTTATGPLTDPQTYAAIGAEVPAGVIAWTDLTD